MKLSIILAAFLAIFNLSACSLLSIQESPKKQSIESMSSHLSRLEQFNIFAARFSKYSAEQKKTECHKLRFKFSAIQDWDSGLALSYAITDFPECGTSKEGLNILAKLEQAKDQPHQLTWLIHHQQKLLWRLKKIQQQNRYLKRSLKRTKEALMNSLGDNNTMELKLIELKAIETSINQRLENQ